MADQPIKLKKKITLRKKESVAFTFTNKLKVELLWSSKTDLDLCLFFKKHDGEVGGVFSKDYRGRKDDLGSLDKFPFIIHMGDEPEPGDDVDCSIEKINVKDLSQIAEAYVCIVNYDAAVEQRDVTYAEEGGRVQLQSDSGDFLEVNADSTDHGPIYLVCSIANRDGEYALKEEGKVLDLSGAFYNIPGFSLICN